MAAPQSAAFQTAIADSKKLTSKPSNDELLDLYGASSRSYSRAAAAAMVAHRDHWRCLTSLLPPALFKVGTGEDFAAASQPGMFDLKVRYTTSHTNP